MLRFFEDDDTGGLPAQMIQRLRLIHGALDEASVPRMLHRPTFKLHPLQGERQGEWSIWVNGNWRVTFRFEGSDVVNVDLEDYH